MQEKGEKGGKTTEERKDEMEDEKAGMTDPTTETIAGLRSRDVSLTTRVDATDVISIERGAVAGLLVPPADRVVEVFFLPKSRRVRFATKCLKLVSVLIMIVKKSMGGVI